MEKRESGCQDEGIRHVPLDGRVVGGINEEYSPRVLAIVQRQPLYVGRVLTLKPTQPRRRQSVLP